MRSGCDYGIHKPMFDFGEVDRFLSGQLTTPRLSRRNDTLKFWFERKRDGHVVAYIPIRGDRSKDPF